MDDRGMQYWQTVGQWEREELESDPQYQEWIESQDYEFRKELEHEMVG